MSHDVVSRDIDNLGDAVCRNDERAVLRLVQNAPQEVLDGARSKDYFTAVGSAAYCNYHTILRILLRAKCSVHGCDQETGLTPLNAACSRESVEAVRILIAAKVNVDRRSKDGGTATYGAIQHGNLGALGVLLEAKADINIGAGPDNIPPLMRATNMGNSDVVALLIENKVAVNNGDNTLYRPLYVHGAGMDTSSLY